MLPKARNSLAKVVPVPLPTLTPAARALIAQLAAVSAVLFVFAPAAGWFGLELPVLAAAFLQGATAAVLGRAFSLAWWWLPINLLFAPAVVALLAAQISPVWYLGAFLLLLSVYWSVARTRVPLYLSSRQAWAAVAARLPSGPGFSFADLGAGLGGLPYCLARQRPDGMFHGIEAAPLPFLTSWLRTKPAARNCRMVWGSFWKQDISRFDVVYAYLSPAPMEALWRKVRAEMRPGALFISNTFAVPGVPPAEVVQLDDLHRSKLYVYRL